jgi:hypothetical protein
MRILYILLIMLIPSISGAVTRTVTTRAAFDAAVNATARGDIIRIPAGSYTNWGNIVIPPTKDMDSTGRVYIEGEQDAAGNNLTIFQGQNAFEIEFRAANWTIRNVTWRGQTVCSVYDIRSTNNDNALVTFNGSQNTGMENVLITDHGVNQATGATGFCIRVVKTAASGGTRNTTGYFIRNSTFRNIWQRAQASFIYISGHGPMGAPVGGEVTGNFFDTRACSAATVERRCYWLKSGDSPGSTEHDANFEYRDNFMRFTTIVTEGQDDFHIKARGWRVIDNVFEGAGRLTFRQGNGHLIARNTWINPRFNQIPQMVVLYGENHSIINNLSYSTVAAKYMWKFGMGNVTPPVGQPGYPYPDYPVFTNSVVAHNTCDGFVGCFIANNVSSGVDQGATTVYPSNIRFHNNAVRQATGTMFVANNCANTFSAVSHNARSGAAAAGCMATGALNINTTNMQFVAVGSNYDLQATSPLINAGVNVAGVLETDFDIDGNQRNDPPDIGAYEGGGAPPPPPDTGNDCDTLFGTAPGYQFCSQTATTCRFAADLSTEGGTCAGICASFGCRACMSADNNGAALCTSTGASTCTGSDTTKICECEKNFDPLPPTTVTRHVDSSCPTNGTGETTTCGANGPWRSITHGMVTLDCAGMGPGSIIEVRGNDVDNSQGNWYGGIYSPDFNVSPDAACSGMIIRNRAGTYVNMDGTVDIKGSGWVAIGAGGVFECQTGTCGPLANYPYAAWAKIGATEHKLDLIQSVRTCSASLASGKMTYNDATRRVCVHLPGNINPNTTTYLRIPYQESAFRLQNENVDGLTFQSHPDGGRFIVQRYRDNLFEMAPTINQNITIRDMELAWAGSRAIVSNLPKGDGHYKFINNHIHHIGLFGMRIIDRSTGLIIEGNTIHDIGKAPDWERCQGVGAGCFAASENPNGIYLDGGDAVGVITDAGTHGTIRGNEVYNIGEGRQGQSYGIQLTNGSYRTLVENNLIRDSTTTGVGFWAILFEGIAAGSSHENTMVRNNRMENVDWCIALDFADASDQTGKVFFVYGNTCRNPIRNCWIQQANPNLGHRMRFRNNLCSKDNGYVKLMNVPASTTWSEYFWNNGFECSHAACAGQDIVTYQGLNFKRDGECTEGTNCLADALVGGNNISGSFLVQTGTLQIIEGSDAIDTGGLGLDLPTDYLGTDRLGPSSGLRTDIGAHEFQFSETPIPLVLVQDGYRYYGRLRTDREGPLGDQNTDPLLYKNSQWNMRLGVHGSPDSSHGEADVSLYYQHCTPSCGSYAPITPNCTDNPLCLVDNPAIPSGTPAESDLVVSGKTLVPGSQYIEADLEDEGFVSLSLGPNERVELVYSLGAGAGVDQGHFFNLQLRYADGTVMSYGALPVVMVAQAKSRYEFNR